MTCLQMGFLLFSQRPRLMCWVGGWEWATALVARVVLTSPPTPAAKTTPLAWKILCVSRRVLWKSLSIRVRVSYHVLDVLANLFLEVLVEFLPPKQSQFGPTWLPNRSNVHEHLVQNRSWAVSRATLDTRSNIIKQRLTFWSLFS